MLDDTQQHFFLGGPDVALPVKVTLCLALAGTAYLVIGGVFF